MPPNENTLPADNPSPKIAAIRAYSAARYPLIPLSGKKPSILNWPHTPPGRYGDANLPRNYGVVLSETDLVIDLV